MASENIAKVFMWLVCLGVVAFTDEAAEQGLDKSLSQHYVCACTHTHTCVCVCVCVCVCLYDISLSGLTPQIHSFLLGSRVTQK